MSNYEAVDDPVTDMLTLRGEFVNAMALALHNAKENGHPLWDDLWPNVSRAEICLDAFFAHCEKLEDVKDVLSLEVWRLIHDTRAGF